MLFLSLRGGAGGSHEAPTLQPFAGILKILPQHLLHKVYHIAAGTTSEAVEMVAIQVARGCPLAMERTAHFTLNYLKAETFCGAAQVVPVLQAIHVNTHRRLIFS